ncbi:MAG TPA: hypothetical protein VFG55_08295 [Rhodanobacteraceae bacterium]|nr:hypothetical protein [Rhodanobacteraceae bacterium]
MNGWRGFAVAALLFAAADVRAGSVPVPSDVSVDFSAEPDTGLVTGQSIYFTLSVTNHGPEPVSEAALVSTPFVNEFDGHDASTNCQNLITSVVDGQAYYYLLLWYLTDQGVLAVGETRSCQIRLVATSHMPAVFLFGFSTLDPDINPSNDSATVTLRRAAVPIAAPIPVLSRTISLLLIALLLVTGVFGRRSHNRQATGDRRPYASNADL